MKSIKQQEEELFAEWAKSKGQTPDEFLTNGGLLLKGDFFLTAPDEEGKYSWYRHSADEEERWCKSAKRLMILTKDLPEPQWWDIRAESGGRDFLYDTEVPEDNDLIYRGDSIYRMLNRLVYGIYEESDGNYPAFNEVTDYNKMGRYYEAAPLVRINCKITLGKSSVTNEALRNSIDENAEFLAKQIALYQANIILCCGYTEKDKNIILDFVTDNVLKDLKVLDETDKWIYYSKERNVIVINSYHPSIRWKDQVFYDGLVGNFSAAIKKNNIKFTPLKF